MNRDLMAELKKHSVGGPKTYLILFPASGTLKRMHGTFSVFDLGGESKWTPFIYGDEGVCAVDSRCMIYDAHTLDVVFHSRKEMHRTHAAAKQWFTENKHVFNYPVVAGFSLVGTVEET